MDTQKGGKDGKGERGGGDEEEQREEKTDRCADHVWHRSGDQLGGPWQDGHSEGRQGEAMAEAEDQTGVQHGGGGEEEGLCREGDGDTQGEIEGRESGW